MDGLVPKRPGIQQSLFVEPSITITNKTEPALYIGKKPEKKASEENSFIAVEVPQYNAGAIANIVRAYLTRNR